MMRCWAVFGLFWALPAAAAPVAVGYKTVATAGSWRPLEPADIARSIGHAALEELSRSGSLQLQAEGDAPSDYRLQIRGHLLDEAETHTVYVSFGPGQKSDVPSLEASDTVALSKLSRDQMLERIQASARKAAGALAKSLDAALAKVGRPVAELGPDPFAGVKVPWQWAEVRIPKPAVGKAGEELYAKQPKVRAAALRELTSLALQDPAPRQALERCALQHPDAATRLGCLVGLKPLAASSDATRRIIIQVYRSDTDSKVRAEASEQMHYFPGASQKEAIQAWLESTSKGQDTGPLAHLGDLPNLDLAIRGCLHAVGKHNSTKNYAERAHQPCLELLTPVPYARRKAILWRFLEEKDPHSPFYLPGAGDREGSIGTPWQRGFEALLDIAPHWDPALEEILWARYQRDLSSAALSALADHGAPSERLANRLLEVIQTAGAVRALWGVRRLGRDAPELRPLLKEKLAELVATNNYPKTIRSHDLEEVLRGLENPR